MELRPCSLSGTLAKSLSSLASRIPLLDGCGYPPSLLHPQAEHCRSLGRQHSEMSLPPTMTALILCISSDPWHCPPFAHTCSFVFYIQLGEIRSHQMERHHPPTPKSANLPPPARLLAVPGGEREAPRLLPPRGLWGLFPADFTKTSHSLAPPLRSTCLLPPYSGLPTSVLNMLSFFCFKSSLVPHSQSATFLRVCVLSPFSPFLLLISLQVWLCPAAL